jgi:hypothetical protein
MTVLWSVVEKGFYHERTDPKHQKCISNGSGCAIRQNLHTNKATYGAYQMVH